MNIKKLILLELVFVSFIHLHYGLEEGKIPKEPKGKDSKENDKKASDSKPKTPKEGCGKVEVKAKGAAKSSGNGSFQIQVTFQGAAGFSITQAVKDAILEVIAAELAISACSLGAVTVTHPAGSSVTFSVMATLSEDVVNSLKSLSLDSSSVLATLKTKITVPVGVSISSFTLDSAPLLTETETPTSVPTGTPTSIPTNTPSTPTSTPTRTPTRPTATPTSSPSLGIMDITMIPYDIAVGSDGNKYIGDIAYSVVRKISPTGVVTVLAGQEGTQGTADGSGSSALFVTPVSITVDTAGFLYVADTYAFLVRKVSPAGDVSTIVGKDGSGAVDGDGTTAQFGVPLGLAFDSNGYLFVSDGAGRTIRKIVMSGDNVTVSTIAGSAYNSGSTDGVGDAARFNSPGFMTVDTASNIYVTDGSNQAIRKITPGAEVTTFIRSVPNPFGIAIDADGYIYASCANAHNIIKVSPDGSGFITWAGSESEVSGYSDGTGTEALFNTPFGINIDGSGNIFVAELGNGLIRKISPSQQVTTFAGKYYVP